MILLSAVPTIPRADKLAELQATFFDSFGQHIFFESLPFAKWCSGRPPPYLQLALACLGSVSGSTAGSNSGRVTLGALQEEVHADLFVAGVSLWTVMLEVDNRESRLCEAVIAVGPPRRESNNPARDKTKCSFLFRLHSFPPTVCCRRPPRTGENRLASHVTWQLYTSLLSLPCMKRALMTHKIARRTHQTDGYSPAFASIELPGKAFGVKR